MFPTLSLRYRFWLNLFSLFSLKNQPGLSEHCRSIWFTFNQYPFEHLNVFMMPLLIICSKSINQLNCFFFSGSFYKPLLIQDSSWDMSVWKSENQNKVHLGSRSKIMARPWHFLMYMLLIYFLQHGYMSTHLINCFKYIYKEADCCTAESSYSSYFHWKCFVRVWKVDLRGYVCYSK